MRVLSAIQLIELGALAEDEAPHWRLEPLVAACAGDGEVVGEDTLGRRNQRLIELYRQLTNRPMEARTRCTACATDNEFAVPADAILACPVPQPLTEIQLSVGSRLLRFRVPSMDDLRMIERVSRQQASSKLASACLVQGSPRSVTKSVVARLDRRLETLDPAARIELDLSCAECRSDLRVLVDIAGIVTAALDQSIEKLLREVHVVATAYGWSEEAILKLPSSRRRRYLAMISASGSSARPLKAVRS